MSRNRELEAGLKAIAEDQLLPGGGRKKLSRLVAEHLHWFDAAERRGMSWRDMVRALAAAGITDGGGKPLSVGTLSSTVWRKRSEVAKGAQHASRPARATPSAPSRPHRKPTKEPKLSSVEPPRTRHVTSRPVDNELQAGRGSPTPSQRSVREFGGQNKEVLAFMNRARAVRERSK